jgi:hypothetical protein
MFERAAESVRAIALVHAEWWESPKLESLTWMPRRSIPGHLGGRRVPRVWDHFVELFGARLPEGAVALGRAVGSSWEATCRRRCTTRAPITLCHGDFRADNLMFDDSVTGDGTSACSTGRSRTARWASATCRLPDRPVVDHTDAPRPRSGARRQWYDELSSTLGRAPDDYTTDDAWDGYRKATANDDGVTA